MSNTIEGKEFWEQELERFKASGLSQSQYCRENKVNYDRFSYWLKRLSPAETSTFVPVKLHEPEPISSHCVLCTLEWRGHILKIHDRSVLALILERLI